MIRSRKWVLICLLAIIGFSSCESYQGNRVSNIEESFVGIEQIQLNGKWLEMTYEGREGEKDVLLSAYLETKNNTGDRINFRVRGNTLLVDVEEGDSWNWFDQGRKGFISLIGPEDIKIKATNGSGLMEITNVYSDQIDLSINSGRLKAKNLGSDNVRLKASSGKIEAERISGSVYCVLSSGNATLHDINGNLEIKGSSGSFNIEDVDGTVSGSMSSGGLSLKNIKELGKLSISSGRINAENAGLGGSTELNGSSGSISVQTPDDLTKFNFELTASSGSLQVGDTKSGKELRKTNDADRTVRGNIRSGRLAIVN